jgi:hypothetical protein
MNLFRRTALAVTTILILSGTALSQQLQTTYNTESGTGFSLQFSANDFRILKVSTPLGDFSEIRLQRAGSRLITGEPDLPVFRQLVDVPLSAEANLEITYSEFTEYALSDLGIHHYIMPCQPSVSKCGETGPPEFVMDKSVYETDAYTGGELVRFTPKGLMRYLNLYLLEISPVQYNPVSKKIRVYHRIDVSVSYSGADYAASDYLRASTVSPYHLKASRAVAGYHQIAPKANLTQYPVKLVIVSDPMFQSALQPFVAWKTKKGFTVIEAYTNMPSVGNTTTSIKNYLQGLYNSATPSDPAPAFVLFVGDVAQVPAFAGNAGSHATDMLYCEYTGDHLPELYYGRFSATNVSELQPQIDKTLEYEQFLMPSSTFLDTCVMIAGQDATYGPTFGDGQINYGTDTYFNGSNGYYSFTYLHAVSATSAAAIRQNVSRGVGYANYTAHGSTSGWADPSFTVSDVPNLQNNHKYPLMVGNCCQTNTFNQPVCFGEALLRAANKGAIGYIGGSNNTYWYEDYWWGVGFRNFPSGNPPLHPVYEANNLGAYDRTFHSHGEAFSEWFPTQGQMVAAGNLAVTQSGSSSDEYYWEIYHLMGDPSLMVYYTNPDPMSVSYPGLLPIGTTSFTITTNAPYSYAALSMGGVLHGAALADSNGVVNISILPFTVPGVADVVVTCQNRQPYIGTINVASPSGPYVLHTKIHIDDVAGNNDTIADFGEQILLDVTLKNYGAADANTVQATLSTSDIHVSVIDNQQSWGNISSNTSATQNGAFSLLVSNNCPDMHTADFTISIQDNNSNTWTSGFQVQLHAPVLDIGSIILADTGGNGNGAPDAGETILVIIESLNNGHSDAPNTTGLLTTTSPWVTINSGNHAFGTLAKSGNENAVFSISVSSSIPDSAVIDLSYALSSGTYLKQNQYLIPIGSSDEDWESGDFSQFQWVQGGSAPWFITTDSPYEGLYCAQSGDISDNQTSELSITMNITSADTITFWKKVSCEQGGNWGGSYSWYDYMEFQINGNSIERWDGQQPWSKYSYVVLPGQLTFKWVYSKDYSVSDGSDAAWVDFISFPPVMTVIASVEENETLQPSLSCYPNPAEGMTTLLFTVTKESLVSLMLTDIQGRTLQKFIDRKTKRPGQYPFAFNAASFASGVYLVVFEAGNRRITQKIILR